LQRINAERQTPNPKRRTDKMHELSIASAVVDSILEFVGERSVKRVIAVRLAIGELSHVEEEQLRFCYMAITQETLIQDSALEIDRIPAVVRCHHCEYSGRPKYWEDALSAAPVATLQCPNCGGAVEPVEGTDCAIKSVRFVSNEPVESVPGSSDFVSDPS
jgi:hydrogenase nickel incorporation protein HypA/HybF